MCDPTYNTWYNESYDTILEMANWQTLSEEIPKKIVCVFSWMPCTIMNIKHSENQFKWQIFSLKEVEIKIKHADLIFNKLREFKLLEIEIIDFKIQIIEICELLKPIFGTVVMSKYLHFSAPFLFPMWDRGIRTRGKYADDENGYFAYICKFKQDLIKEANIELAQKEFKNNPIRGWDIYNMKQRKRTRKSGLAKQVQFNKKMNAVKTSYFHALDVYL